MKKILIIILLTSSCVCTFGQALTTNKAETIALLTSHFSKTNGLKIKDEDGDYTLKDCKLTYEKGAVTITQTVFRNSNDYWTNTYQFCPLFIEVIGDASNDFKREEGDQVGSIRIFNPDNKVFWRSISFPENTNKIMWHNSTISLSTFYDGAKGSNKIEKGLLRLQQLLKLEADPFELTTDQKRLAFLFDKYKSIETGTKPSATSKGSKIIVENIKLAINGPMLVYSNKKSTTKEERYYDDNAEEAVRVATKTNFSTNELWWRNVISMKYNVVFGTLVIKTGYNEVAYSLTEMGSSKPSTGKTESLAMFFKPASADINGEVKKDVLEIISLIKKNVLLYGGGNVKVEINEL